MPWLLKAEPYDAGSAGIVTLFFSDAGFITEPGDSPPNVYWQRRIDGPLSVTRSIYAGAAAGGQAEIVFGDCVLANDDGALDGLAAYDWGGRRIEISYAAAERPVLADFAVVLNGTAEQVTVGERDFTIKLRDIRVLFEVPCQPAKFAGTGGAEGAAGYNERRKPRVLGLARVFEPVLINAAYQVYAYGSGPGGGVLTARDRGLAFTAAGPDFPDYASLIAAPGVGYGYFTCDALSLIRFVATPVGPVTIDALGPVRGPNLVASSFTAGVTQTAATVAGRWYVLRAQVTLAAGTLLPRAGAATGPLLSASGRVVMPFRASSASTTVDFVGSGFSGSITNASVVEWLGRAADLVDYVVDTDTTLASSDFAPGTIAALNGLCPQLLGHWYDGSGELQANTLLDQIVNSVGAYYGFDEDRRIVLGRFDGPAALAEHRIDERDIEEIEPLDVERRLKSQIIGYRRCWRPHGDQDLAGAVPAADREALRVDYLKVTAADPSVAVAALLSREERYDTLLDDAADATAEAARRLALHSPPHRAFAITIKYRPSVDVGETVAVTHSRYGLSGGGNFLIMKTERDARSDRIRLEVWK